MIAYVGQRAKRRKRRMFFTFFLIVLLIVIIFSYYNYNSNLKKITSENKILVNNNKINTQELNESIEDYEIKVI